MPLLPPASASSSTSAPAPAGLTPSTATPSYASTPHVAHARLDNGMEVVVIPDHRAPVVTHMVWYRNGSADDPAGKSGIAHFLEHLMFKGTEAHPQGVFSEAVAEVGGQENAFTSTDYTAYFQRAAKQHLGMLMGFEADRMTGLVLTDAVVDPERDVVLEERRMRTDTDPSAQLQEAVQATVFSHHPYGTPIIGWNHEIETLGRQDALDYYNRFYTPENAILIVAGDVEPEAVVALAKESYGRVPARGETPERHRRREPEARAHRLVTLADPKVEQPSVQRLYIVPSYRTAAPGQAAALEVLGHILGGGSTSVIYKALVLDQKIAVAAGAYYMGTALDDTRFMIWALPSPETTLEALDAAIEAVVQGMATTPVAPDELERAQTRLVADAVYAQDNQSSLARWYGAALATGQTVADVERWPAEIEAVTAEDVRAAAAAFLVKKRAVTGFLVAEAA